MASPFYDIERKAELAVQSVLSSVDLDGVPVYIATDTADETEDGQPGIRVPYIMIACTEATPEMPGMVDGVYVCPVNVEVWSHRHDEPGATHSGRLAKVRDALIEDGLADALSESIGDFHCFYCRGATLSAENDASHAKGIVSLELVCAASDL